MLDPNAAIQNAGGGSISSTLTFDFSDTDGDITTVRFSSGGQNQDASISGISGIKSGSIQGALLLSTTTLGTFTFQISLIDAKGHLSNALTGTFQVTPPPPSITSISPQTVAVGGPAFTLTIQGTGFYPDSVTTWNGNPRPTTYTSASSLQATIPANDIGTSGTNNIGVVNPTNEGGASTTLPLAVTSLTTQVVPAITNDLVWDAIHGHLYASIPSNAGSNGNSIMVIDPTTATSALLFVGSEPNRMAISDDGQFLYVGLDGASVIKRLLLPSLIEDIAIPLGSDPNFGPYYAVDIQVAPGASTTVAVSLGCKSVSPSAQGGVAVFDNATQRVNKSPGWSGTGYLFGSLQWGSDPSTLLAANGEDGGGNFYVLAVDATGIAHVNVVPSAFPSTQNAIHFDATTGLVYADSGWVITSTDGHPVGTFGTQGSMVPVPSLNTAYFLGQTQDQTGAFTLFSLDLTHFTPLTSAGIPGPVGSRVPTVPSRLLRWGSNGLASGGRGNPVNLYTFAPSHAAAPAPALTALTPATSAPGGAGFTLTLQGGNFFPDSVVYWNGTPRVTTYVSGTSLSASISAPDVANSATSQVYVLNPTSEGGISNPLAFTISSVPTIVVGQTVNDLVWDGFRNVLYASLPSAAGPKGNSIVVIDPASGLILNAVFAGSEPNRLSMSDDGQFLYVGLDGGFSIKRFLLPTLTEDITIPLGWSTYNGANLAHDLQAAPGLPHTIAVSRIPQGDLVVFDDATQRPQATARWAGSFGSLQWGADSSTLYASNTEDTGFDFYTLSVTPSGVRLLTDQQSTFSSFHDAIHYEPMTNLIYSGSGEVLNSSGHLVGTFAGNGAMTPVPAKTAACFLSWSPTQYGSFTLASFHLTHFTALASAQIPLPYGVNFPTAAPSRLIAWGGGGLASCGAGNPVNIYGSAFLGSRAPAGQQTALPGTIHPTGLLLNICGMESVGLNLARAPKKTR